MISTMYKVLQSTMIWRCCIYNTFGKTMRPHDFQLALKNVVEVQKKVVAMDKQIS